MRTRFTDITILLGGVLAHTACNFVLVACCWIIFRFYRIRTMIMLGCSLIYFIISYELMFTLLKNVAQLMDIKD